MNRKERFDSLSILYARAWENFNDRRKIEFKISFSLYTLFSFAIAGLVLYADKLPNKPIIRIGIAVLGGFLVLFHFLWCRKANQTNFLDRQIAIHYERIMQEISESGFKKELLELMKKNYMHEKEEENNSKTNSRTYVIYKKLINWFTQTFKRTKNKTKSENELKYPSLSKNWSMLIQILISVCLFFIMLLLACIIQYKPILGAYGNINAQVPGTEQTLLNKYELKDFWVTGNIYQIMSQIGTRFCKGKNHRNMTIVSKGHYQYGFVWGESVNSFVNNIAVYDRDYNDVIDSLASDSVVITSNIFSKSNYNETPWNITCRTIFNDSFGKTLTISYEFITEPVRFGSPETYGFVKVSSSDTLAYELALSSKDFCTNSFLWLRPAHSFTLNTIIQSVGMEVAFIYSCDL